MYRFKKLLFVLLASFLATISGFSQAERNLTIDANKPYAEVQPAMWGIFFEDINFAADGGIYAELVKNRSFEFYRPLMGWKTGKNDEGMGHILVINRGEEDENNPRFARIEVNAPTGSFTLTDEGFRGMGVKKDEQYNFSVLARKMRGDNLSVFIQLLNGKGEKIGEAELPEISGDWKKYKASFISAETDAKASLKLIFKGNATVDIDMVSLFPKDTWKGRENGLRADMVQMLADLKPGFVRFPGGCIVEGFDLTNRYQWKKTIGNVDDRKVIINRWNTEMRNRQAPDYFESFGLGFYEYFLLCEDLGAEPLPILNCGMACQFNSAEVVPMNQLDPYIQDALDLIEFANGPVTSKWGKVRADLGHPAPFNMKMLGVGNEQWDEQYIERYKVFAKALKEKYPQIKLVTSSGPSPNDARFDYLWGELRKLNADLVDEHYYQSPQWFLSQAGRYDNYDRNGPKVFAGEYAVHGREDKPAESRNTWESALAEAAFMTGLERNADVVQMASYAPLFGNVNAWQWRPDLIWFDNLRVIGTPNYYVQKLYSTNKGTNVVPALNDGKVLEGADSLYASAVIDKNTNEVIVKLANVSSVPVSFNLKLNGAKPSGSAKITTISSPDLGVYNTIDKPDAIVPMDKEIKLAGNKLSLVASGRSFTVIRIPCGKL